MQKSLKEKRLAELLFMYEYNEKGVSDRFKGNCQFDPEKPLSFADYFRNFMQIHIELALEEITEEHEELEINIIPLEDYLKDKRYQSKDYYFTYTPGGRLFSHPKVGKNGLVPQQDYPNLIKVGKLPVLVDIKLSRWKRNECGKDSALKGALENYDDKLRPLRQLFANDLGYIMIIPANWYEERETEQARKQFPNSAYEMFKKSNGIIVPSYTDTGSFKKQVSKQIAENNFKVRT